MPNYYDELEIEDFAWDPVARVFHYPCPCGDRFEISKGQLRDGEEIAICPSCSLIVRVIYDYLDWEDYVTSDEDDDAESVDTPASEDEGSGEGPDAEKAEEQQETQLQSGSVPSVSKSGQELAEAVEKLDLRDGVTRDKDKGGESAAADP
ncbi:hypothetical protein IAU60_003940 [Kwoniella sp. DSM 27419]